MTFASAEAARGAALGAACVLAAIVMAWAGAASLAVFLGAALVMAAASALVPAGTSRRLVIGVGVVLALVGLTGKPLHEDDHYRYLWDGYRTATVGTPYGPAPDAFVFDDAVDPAMRPILDRVNNPEVPTIYGPGLQALFAAGHLAAPGSERGLRALMSLGVLCLVWLLSDRVPAGRLALLAWSPLVFKEVHLTGHHDALVPLLILGGWLASRGPGRRFALAVGVAASVKVVALAAAPALLFAPRKVQAGALLLGGLTLPYLPFMVAGGGSDAGGLLVFADRWVFNPSPVYAGAADLLGEASAKPLLGAVAVAGILFALTRPSVRAAALPPLHVAFGLVLAVSPVVNPWYLLWGLPAALAGRATWPWVATFALLLSYVRGETLDDPNLDPFAVHPAAYAVQWGSILGAVAFDAFRASRRAPYSGTSITCPG